MLAQEKVGRVKKLGMVIGKCGCGHWKMWVWSLGKLGVVIGKSERGLDISLRNHKFPR